MNPLFISTVKYDKLTANGVNKTVSEQYLFDAESFTDAEARTIEKLKPYIPGDFSIPRISKAQFSSLCLSDNLSDEHFYKVKVAFITLDEKTGVEKRKNVYILVQAYDFKRAYKTFLEHMSDTISDFEIVSIAEMPIIEYFPLDEQN